MSSENRKGASPDAPASGSVSAVTEVSDGDLVNRVRAGETEAYGELYRRHVKAATVVALRHTDNSSDADDMVAEAFSSTLNHLVQGKGPDSFFRAYILTAVSRLSHRANQKASRVMATDSDYILDQRFEDDDALASSFEVQMVSDSFRNLPERWRSVLWYLEIEGMKPAQAAPLLGLAPNAVSALAIRAKEGLRRSYLAAHAQGTNNNEECAQFSRNVATLSKKGPGRARRKELAEHASGCLKCGALLEHLNDIQTGLRGVLFPLVAGIPFVNLGGTPLGTLGTGTASAGRALSSPPGVIATVAGGLVAAVIVAAGILQNNTPAPAPVPENPPTAVASPTTTPTPTVSVSAEPTPAATPSLALPTVPVQEVPAAIPTPDVPAVVPVPSPPAPAQVPTPPPAPRPTPVENSVFPSSSVIARDASAGTTSVYVDFAVLGEDALSDATVTFSLESGSSFASAPGVPAGWTCTRFSEGAASMSCSTGSAVRGDLSFTLNTAAADPARSGTLSYAITGTGIKPAQGGRQI